MAVSGRRSDTDLKQRVTSIGVRLLPLIVAAAIVSLERFWTGLTGPRDTVLPLATLMFLVAMLHPRLRHFLVITLCFVVCLFIIQARHRIDLLDLPDALRYDLFEAIRPLVVWSIAILAALAGIGESVHPGTDWARRCYFASATLFFLGLGVYDYGWHRSSRSIVLCVTGGVALLFCIFAHRLGNEGAGDADAGELSDEGDQSSREAAHRAALIAKEWRDTLVQAIDDCDPGAGGNAASTRPNG